MWTVIVRDATGNIHSKTQLKTGVIRIGRNVDCDIVLQSPAVSRLHGRLLVAGDGPTLIYSDEKSANGSFVDGNPVVGAVDIGEDNVLTLGEFRLSLEREGGSKSAPGLTSTLIMSPKDVQLIAQAPPPPPPKPAAAPPPAPAVPPPSMVPSAPSHSPASSASNASLAKTVIGPGTKSALPGFEFKDLDALFSKPMEVQQPKTLTDSITSLLDQQIAGIQSHRSTQQETQQSQSQEFEKQWKDALVAVRDLQGKLRGNARVLYFVISRDEGEISIKLADSSKRGHSTLILSKRHPETNKFSEGTVWFGVFGEEPSPYRKPKDALEDFVRRVAAKLA